MALTDEANLFALVKFYKAAEGKGLKPIVGADSGCADPATDAMPRTACAPTARLSHFPPDLPRLPRPASRRVGGARDWLEGRMTD